MATNDLIILVAFVPIVKFLLGVSHVTVPYSVLFLSIFLFVVIPLAGGILTRITVIRHKGEAYFNQVFIHKFDQATTWGLLLTLCIIFSSQAQVILSNPFHILLIAIPLVLQTYLIFAIAYGASTLLHLPHSIAAPAGMIGASNFFELAVAVAIALFGGWGYAAVLGGGYLLAGWHLGAALYMGCFAAATLAACAVLYLWLKKRGGAVLAAL